MCSEFKQSLKKSVNSYFYLITFFKSKVFFKLNFSNKVSFYNFKVDFFFSNKNSKANNSKLSQYNKYNN
jgi:hypothetical protein